jgi:hypothetical protein
MPSSRSLTCPFRVDYYGYIASGVLVGNESQNLVPHCPRFLLAMRDEDKQEG